MDKVAIRAKLTEVMSSILGVDKSAITDDASMDTIKAWDSLKHMKLVIALEQEFSIEFDDTEVVEMLNVKLIELTLAQKVAA